MTSTPQADYWRGQPGQVWAERQVKMDEELGSLGRLALDRLAPAPGESMVDIGCGGASTTLELARRVGPEGRVVGIDFSTPQLEVARRRARELGLAQVSFLDADAETAVVPGAPFDGAFSRFGVMFFADPVAAFANIGRAMAAGGRLAFVCWQGAEANPWFTLAGRALSGLAGFELPPPPPPDGPGPLAFADPDRVRTILVSAGWDQVSVDGHTDELVIPPADLDETIRFRLGMGPVGAALAEAPEAMREEAFRLARERFRAEGGDPDASSADPSVPLRHQRAVFVVTAVAGRH